MPMPYTVGGESKRRGECVRHMTHATPQLKQRTGGQAHDGRAFKAVLRKTWPHMCKGSAGAQ